MAIPAFTEKDPDAKTSWFEIPVKNLLKENLESLEYDSVSKMNRIAITLYSKLGKLYFFTTGLTSTFLDNHTFVLFDIKWVKLIIHIEELYI